MTPLGFAILVAVFALAALALAHARVGWAEKDITSLRELIYSEVKWLQKQNEQNTHIIIGTSKRISELELNQERPANKGAMAKKRTVKAGK